MKLAVIDLGTNTFHILIVEITDKREYKILFKERLFTKLGEQGIHKIGKESYQRSLKAIAHFKAIMDDLGVQKTRVLGTSALREAFNGQQFIDEAKTKFGIDIEVIDGLTEGQLIQKGVFLAIGPQEYPHIIMDIGGGSVEFIFVINNEIKFIKSLNIGLAVLHKIADISDGANDVLLERIDEFLEIHLKDLLQTIGNTDHLRLIGSAGAFEVIVSMLGKNLYAHSSIEIPLHSFQKLYNRIIWTSVADKLHMKGIPPERIDYIGVAFHLIKKVIEKIEPAELFVSKFALKEGVIAESLD
ncbi:MAG: hypothetical protein KJP00_14765 [Bacteroidia bacterium]|nr:hypothetical protein [Bacteroidia bacterium]